jgi:hypothetical protein
MLFELSTVWVYGDCLRQLAKTGAGGDLAALAVREDSLLDVRIVQHVTWLIRNF